MSTPDAILANAPYHTQLLKSIAELDYVPSALAHQEAYVKDLTEQLAQSKKKLLQLAEKTSKERKEHQSLRDSTARRLAHKLTGRKEKYDAKESKEEREYVEALERELTERDSQIVLEQVIGEAKQVEEDLKAKNIQYTSCKNDLATLYSRIFDGPSLSFPEEDELEYTLCAAETYHEQVQTSLNTETRAADILTKAMQFMNRCQSKMQEALNYSRWDMYGGGMMSDMMERSALSTAQALAVQAQRLVDHARRISPQVEPVGRVTIAEGSVFSDVFFDSYWTDAVFHNKIKASATQVLLANNRLKEERDAATRRAGVAGSQLVQASDLLEARRKALDSFRQSLFERVVAQAPAPPTYEQVAEATTAGVTPSAESAQSSSPPQPELLAPVFTNGSSPDPTELPAYSRRGTPSIWGTRNPYAAAIVEQTRSMTEL